MIFNILSAHERKRIRREYLEKWHDWFAWYPVRVSDSKIAWLEVVERRCEYHHVSGKIVYRIYVIRSK